MSAVDEHYKYIHLSSITDAYEKGALRAASRGNKAAAKVGYLNGLVGMEMALSGSEKVVKGLIPGMPRGSSSAHEARRRTGDASASHIETQRFNMEGDEREAAGEADAGGETGGEEEKEKEDKESLWQKHGNIEHGAFGEWKSGSIKCDVNGNLLDPTEQTNLQINTPSYQIQHDLALGKVLSDWLHDPDDGNLEEVVKNLADVEKCWGCLLNLNFNWSLPSVNVLGDIDNFLKQLEDIVDWGLDRLDPDKWMKFWCDFVFGFKFACPSDLIAMLAALNMALMKYCQSAFNLRADWTAILGPIIKAVTEALMALVDQIAGLIYPFIDCVNSMLMTVRQTVDAVQNTYENAKAFSRTQKRNFGNIAGPGSLLGPQASFTENQRIHDVDWDTDSSPRSSTATFGAGPRFSSMTVDRREGSSWHKNSPSTDGATSTPGEGGDGAYFGGHGVPTGFNFTANSTLEEFSKRRQTQWLTPIETVIAIMNDAKKWIGDLVAQLQYAIKSLNSLVSGGLSISFSKSGTIMLILDIIGMIRALVKMHDEELDCDEVDGSLQHAEKLRQELIQGDWGLDTAEIMESETSRPGISYKSKGGNFEGTYELPICHAGKIDHYQEENILTNALSDLLVGQEKHRAI